MHNKNTQGALMSKKSFKTASAPSYVWEHTFTTSEMKSQQQGRVYAEIYDALEQSRITGTALEYSPTGVTVSFSSEAAYEQFQECMNEIWPTSRTLFEFEDDVAEQSILNIKSSIDHLIGADFIDQLVKVEADLKGKQIILHADSREVMVYAEAMLGIANTADMIETKQFRGFHLPHTPPPFIY